MDEPGRHTKWSKPDTYEKNPALVYLHVES